jgi:hypothetical protein
MPATSQPSSTVARNSDRSSSVGKFLPILGRYANELGSTALAPASPPAVDDMGQPRRSPMTENAADELRDHWPCSPA